jgi:hypothetical protein
MKRPQEEKQKISALYWFLNTLQCLIDAKTKKGKIELLKICIKSYDEEKNEGKRKARRRNKRKAAKP